jgi:coproporphyrinogen III oxidase-like Fe-S oxidoreductase
MFRNLFLLLARVVLLGKPSKFFLTRDKVTFPTDLENLGLYLHVPFCWQICPFCPYNKTLYTKELAAKYETALVRELSLYQRILGKTSFNSLYIGGGTPTTMTDSLSRVVGHVRGIFDLGDEIGVELHPNDVSFEKLQMLKKIGVNLVSLGIQSFNNQFLKILGRNYYSKTAGEALNLVLESGFKSVDVDILFSLPNQTVEEVRSDVLKVFNLGVDQVSCYPLIIFPFTKMPKLLKKSGLRIPNLFQEKRMLDTIVNLAEEFGYQRTSIWSFTKRNSPRYTSVTREKFIGIGASSASHIPGYFYINTFSPEEYIEATKERLPIALVAKLERQEEIGWWLFWRFYDTLISKRRFNELFGADIYQTFGILFQILNLLKLTEEQGNYIKLTRTGAFLFHLVEQQYSLSYLNKTWGTLSKNPWPEKLEL